MPEAEIKGAVVVVYTTPQGDKNPRGTVLTSPEFVKLCGRMFLAGSITTSRGHWAVGRRTYVAVDEIVSMIEFDTEEAYREMIQSHGGQRRRRRRWWGG